MENNQTKGSSIGILMVITLIVVVAWATWSYVSANKHIVVSQVPSLSQIPGINVPDTGADPSPVVSSTFSGDASSTPPVNTTIPLTTVMVEGLNIPWDMAFLPSDGMLVTERGGNIIHIKSDGTKVVVKVPRPKPRGEGGLLGITLHPNFIQNHFIYIYMTTSEGKDITKNAVFRYAYNDGVLSDEKIIISDIPGALYHDGGRLEFGPGGLLFVTTGDATISKLAQDTDSLGGKILRVTEDGGIPEINPFKTAVFSYGHRNPQGLAWDEKGRLWSTEHGRTSGKLTGYDEINLIVSGGNYGWPTIEGSSTKEGMISPVLQSGEDDTWAPASLLYFRGKLYFGGLRGESLYEVTVEGDNLINFKKHLFREFGRIRSIRLGPDEMFYITTSNRDGRGTATKGDDKIIRVNPNLL